MADPDLFDDLFLGCALTAYLEQAQLQQGWPDSQATRRRAYQLYEEALAVNNSGSFPDGTGDALAPVLDIYRRPYYMPAEPCDKPMPDTPNPVQTIQVGDIVAYSLSGGAPPPDARGKVIGLFNTRDGKTLADVEWDKLGPPRRLNVQSLAKVEQSDRGV